MKPLILTIIFTLTVCTILFGQSKKDTLVFYRFKVDFNDRSINNNQIYDTSCYQIQYLTPQGFIYTDSTLHCIMRKSQMYFPIQYTSKIDTFEIDTFEFQNIYDGLQQFKEPVIWNSTELDNSIRITVFRDTLPEVFHIEISNKDSKVIKKTAYYGHWFRDIDKGYTEKISKINKRRTDRIKKNIEEIIDEHNHAYKNVILGKSIVIETKFNNKYEFIVTEDLILSVLKQYRKFKRILNSLE